MHRTFRTGAATTTRRGIGIIALCAREQITSSSPRRRGRETWDGCRIPLNSRVVMVPIWNAFDGHDD